MHAQDMSIRAVGATTHPQLVPRVPLQALNLAGNTLLLSRIKWGCIDRMTRRDFEFRKDKIVSTEQIKVRTKVGVRIELQPVRETQRPPHQIIIITLVSHSSHITHHSSHL